MAMPTEVLTVAEVCATLRISKATALAMIREGKIRAVRYGRVIRVPASAVQEFLAGSSAAAQGRSDAGS